MKAMLRDSLLEDGLELYVLYTSSCKWALGGAVLV